MLIKKVEARDYLLSGVTAASDSWGDDSKLHLAVALSNRLKFRVQSARSILSTAEFISEAPEVLTSRSSCVTQGAPVSSPRINSS